ncbi:MAG: hypothetical protein ACI8P9_003405 [Parasphingorhabdus sp.]|jgi:hypothetical protein
MNIRIFLASVLTFSFYWVSANADADEYNSVELAQRALAITVVGERQGGYWVQMTQSVSPDYGILTDQSWDTNDIDDNWYQIYSEQHGTGFCLTVVPSEQQGLDTVVVLNPCDSYDMGQAWRNEESNDGQRFYNAAMSESACLTVIASGEYENLLTMTNCGTGDISTELWNLQGTGRPVIN